MTEDVEQTGLDQLAAMTAWDRLLTEYAAAGAGDDLTTRWTELVVVVTGASPGQVEEQVAGYAPQPTRASTSDGVALEVMNGVSDIVVRLCADVVLYGEADADDLVAEARRINDRYCDLYDLVAERHPGVDFEAPAGDQQPAERSPGRVEAPTAEPAAAAVAGTPAPWQHRTGSPVNSDALGGLVKRLVTAYAETADAATIEALWRSAFGAASGCAAAVIQEVCEAARLPTGELSEMPAANEVAAGFEELFAAAVVRLFAPDSAGDGDLADEARRLVQRRDALFDLMEGLYPGMYETEE